jgi:hypothetical protein
MIERYTRTITFGPAVSRKELEKALYDAPPKELLALSSRIKVRIESVSEARGDIPRAPQ